MRVVFDRVVSWFYIRRIWGTRCSDYEPECHCCRRWAEHDWLFNGGEHPDDMSPTAPVLMREPDESVALSRPMRVTLPDKDENPTSTTIR